ncbi:MAG: hypothetical protein H0X37_15305 [Herpetosiphonaceae bacterium]|nr:hypothetical protein [Herpetosiphonaceae bacterium]
MSDGVKAVGESDTHWELDVLGCPYGGPNGGRDVDGEFFSPATEFHADKFGLPPVVYYHGYDGATGKPAGSPEYIGRTTAREVKSDGVWYRVVLDRTNALAQQVWEAAQKGVARASSGAVTHLMRVGRDGHILQWPVVELSVFDAVGRRQPANAYAVALPAVKAVYMAAGMELPRGVGMSEQEALTLDDVHAAVAAGIKAAKEEWEQEAAAQRRLPDASAGTYLKFGETRAYDNLGPDDLAVMAYVLDSAKQSGTSRGGVSEAALKALALGLSEDKGVLGQVGRQAMKAQGIKANEIMQQGLVGFGRDWVGQAFSQAIWEKIRIDTFVASMLPAIEVPQGFESLTLPLEGADPTFYKVGEAASTDSSGWPAFTIPSSQAVTGKRTLPLAKMGARVLWSGEMEEDSLAPFVPQLKHQLSKSGAEQLEHAIIDGDVTTTATTNVNDIGNGSAQTSTNLYLMFDGFRKLALVTNTSNSRAGATLALSDFLNTVQLMGVSGINALDRSKVSFIVDPITYFKALNLTQVQTKDVFSSPTIEGGQLTGLYGYALKPSGFLAYKGGNLTNTAGKVDQTTPANNTKGTILAVRWDQWLLGWRRKMNMEVTRIARADTTEIVCLMRLGLINRDTEATAVTYNVS